MAGGLLNIISVGNNSVFLTGNPSTTFFRVVYTQYTNFGMQKFRVDYEGMRELRVTDPSVFSFKIPRYAELLMDTYLVINLPDIWSPIYPPAALLDTTDGSPNWSPYEFRWIRDIGTQIIQEITITCGSFTLQKYSGHYLAAVVDRDFTQEKKDLFNQMSGNIPELYDPANAFGRTNSYPSAILSASSAGAEPSIRGRRLYIPINTWFTLDSRCAFPLVSNQYNELYINVTLRPIQDLFQVRDVTDTSTYGQPYIRPDFNQQQFQMYRFLSTPPSILLEPADYPITNNTWNADVHLMCTYCFLSKEETEVFAKENQVYLVKDVFEYNFHEIAGSRRLKLLSSSGMVANWMWFFQRNDVNMRNEWSNYTNWPYRGLPSNVTPPANMNITVLDLEGNETTVFNLYTNPNGKSTRMFLTGDYNPDNQKEIMQSMGILLNGEYREKPMESEIFDYIEKYVRTKGFATPGLYCYNFCLNTDPRTYQPSGAINISKFNNIEFEVTTYTPTSNQAQVQYSYICDGATIIGYRKANNVLYEYDFNMTIMEERYNVLSFVAGTCGMLYAR
jgi:hypothetical protein